MWNLWSTRRQAAIGNMGNGVGALCRPRLRHIVYDDASARRYKVLILGASRAGKTTLFRRLLDQPLGSEYEPSTSVEIGAKLVRLDGRQPILVELWDVPHRVYSGNRIYDTYLRGIDGAMLVYNVSSPPSWQVAVGYQALVSSDTNDSSIPLLFIGNKADLAASAEPDAARLAREWLAQHAGTARCHELVSALTQQHTLQVLRAMAAMVTAMAR